jgi:hypothetical protein
MLSAHKKSFIFFLVYTMSHRYLLLTLIAVLIAAMFWSLDRKLEASRRQTSLDETQRTLYLVSPFEWMMVSNNEELWPKRFHRHFPLRNTRVPQLFEASENKLEKFLISSWEYDLFRSWSVLVNASHKSALLRALLTDKDAQTLKFSEAMKSFRFKDHPKCHLLWMEAHFRLAQVQVAWREEILKTVKSCEGGREAFAWFELEPYLKGDKTPELTSMADSFNKVSESHPPTSFPNFYYEQLSKLADYAATHGSKFQFEL